LPEDEALEKALIELRTLTIERIDHSLHKRTLCGRLEIIIEVSVGLCVLVSRFGLERSVIAIADENKTPF
jgi:hypothetical protein